MQCLTHPIIRSSGHIISDQKLTIMLYKLAIATLVLAVAAADNALTTCPKDPPVEPFPLCAIDLECDWPLDTLDGTGTITCSCTSGKAFECTAFALGDPVSEVTVTTCPDKSPTTLTSSDPTPLCEIDYNLTCSWPYDVENGYGTETCSCISGNAFGECTVTAVGDAVSAILISTCPETGPSQALNSDPTPICDRDLNCTWPFVIENGYGTETCSCAPDTGFICQIEAVDVPLIYYLTTEISSCPADPIQLNETFDNYTCTSDFNCTWVLDIPDGAGGMDCECVTGSVLLCSAWAVLAESVDPSTLPAGHVVGGMGGSKGGATKKKDNKGMAVMSMVKRKEEKKAKGEKTGGKKMDQGLRGRGR
jgi:hypothetical protein